MMDKYEINKNLKDQEYDLEKVIREVTKTLESRKIDGVEKAIERAYKHVIDTDDKLNLGNVIFLKGTYASAKNQFKLAIKFYSEAMCIFEEIGDLKRIIDTALKLGSIQGDIGFIDDALKSYYYTLEKINEADKYLATKAGITNNLGLLYQNMNDYENALKFYLESYKIYNQQKMNYVLPIITYNIASTYFFMEQFEASKKYIDISLKVAKDNDSELDYLFSESIDMILTYRIDLNEETLSSRSQCVFERIETLGDLRDHTDLYKWFAKAMYSLSEYEKAKEKLEEFYPILLESDLVSILVDVGGLLEKVYVKLGDFESAYKISQEVLKKKENEISLDKTNMEQMVSGYDALENKGYVYNLENTLRIFKLLSKVGEGITYNIEIKSIYEYIIDQIYDIWKLDVFGLGIKNEDSKYMEYYYHSSEYGSNFFERDLDNENVLMNYCALNEEEIIIQDTRLIENYQNKFTKNMVKLIYESSIRSIIFLPLYTDEGVVGGITVQSNIAEYFKTQDLEVFRILASYCSAAVSNHKRHLKLMKMKDLDGLTGVYNRQALINRNDLIEHNPGDFEFPLLVVMLDIDYFKKYNDNYGHLAGDQCLIEVSNAINTFTESYGGGLYRYGGDEFVIVIENMDEIKGEQFLNDMIYKVRKLNIPHEYHKSSNQVTLSIGAGIIKAYEKESMEDYYKEIDKLLYEVKKQGRDNFCIGELT